MWKLDAWVVATPVTPMMSLHTIVSSATRTWTETLRCLQFRAENAVLQTVGYLRRPATGCKHIGLNAPKPASKNDHARACNSAEQVRSYVRKMKRSPREMYRPYAMSRRVSPVSAVVCCGVSTPSVGFH